MKAFNKGFVALWSLMFVGLSVQAFEFSAPRPDQSMLAICQCMDSNNPNKDSNCRQLTGAVLQEQTANARGGILQGPRGHQAPQGANPLPAPQER